MFRKILKKTMLVFAFFRLSKKLVEEIKKDLEAYNIEVLYNNMYFYAVSF